MAFARQKLILAFFLKPVVLILEPYVQQFTQWITSSAFQRKVIKFIVGLIVLLILLGVSFVAYVSFYWLYIPQRGHVGQVHLQYDRPSAPGIVGHGPTAEVDFLRGGRYGQFLRADQAYDISVNLHVPASEKNVEIGNFMIMVTLQRADGTSIMTSSRPAILTYQSQPLKLMRTAWKAVPLVLDWSKEDQHLKVPLVENYVEDVDNPVARATIEISTPDLQVYKSTIHIVAHFHGLRQISTALVFMSVFIFWEIIFSVVTWQVLAAWFGSDSEALAIAHQIHQQSGAPRIQPGQFGQQQSLRAPSNTSRTQVQSSFSPPRQPQLQEQGQSQKLRNVLDSELEDEQDLLAGSSRGRVFDHDEMEDDDNDQSLSPQDLRGQASTLRDEAVVPERPLTPSQRRYEGTERIPTASTSTAPLIQKSHLQRNTVVETDDGASTSGSTTTTGSARRTTGRSGFGMSMSPSSSLQPPPPPPPSVLSERSSEFQMSQTGGSGVGVGGRRTAVESEYTEEEEYLEGAEDDDDDGDVTFDEDDFTEAAHLSRSPGASSSVRSRHATQTRSSGATRSGASEGAGRSTGRA
ncbi:Berardinelli-Seip congenital lipodystrophy 2 (seipin) [Mortierella sp. AM989]|nr:Berardinelli-Seip congenital lipodystrophy 2 (seipin) [Mortierella sp. AM989]